MPSHAAKGVNQTETVARSSNLNTALYRIWAIICDLFRNAGLDAAEINLTRFLMIGYTYNQIAEHLQCSVRTVKYRTRRIYGKLHIGSRAEFQRVLWGYVFDITIRAKTRRNGTGEIKAPK